MVEATSSLSGLGFSPLNYVEMWTSASRTTSVNSAFATASGSSRSLVASTAAGSARVASAGESFAGSAATSTLASSGSDVSEQVALEIARLKAAAQLALRNRATQLAAGAGYVSSGGSYAYTIGPDGQLYATGVVVSYDTAPVANNPQATIEKMQQVRAAALASSSPTASDYAAAATATQLEMQARLEILQKLAGHYLGTESADSAYEPGMLLTAQA